MSILHSNLEMKLNNNSLYSTQIFISKLHKGNRHVMSTIAYQQVIGNIELNPGPRSSSSNSENINLSNVNIYFSNMNGLSKTKLAALQSSVFPDYDIICLAETKLQNNYQKKLNVESKGFDHFFKHRDTIIAGGGVGAFVRSEIDCKIRTDLEIDDVECMWLELTILTKKIIVRYLI